MRVIFGAVALTCLVGAALAVLQGNWRSAAAFAFGFWVMAGWFVAMSVSRAAQRGDEGFHRGEGDE